VIPKEGVESFEGEEVFLTRNMTVIPKEGVESRNSMTSVSLRKN